MQFKQKEGSVIGGVLLVAGSCIGAGMLALPVITSLAGFLPSLVIFLAAWLFMTATGFLLLEVNLALGSEVSLISMAQKTLGPLGRLLCWLLFIFLFYSLGVAYVAASGSILHDIVYDLGGMNLSASFGSALFTLAFGIVVYLGTKPVDHVNRFLMAGLIIAYVVLVSVGSRYVQSSLLAVHHWKYAYLSIPILIVSFGFHNMIPSLSHYLKGDVKRLRYVIFFGSLIPLIIYLVWEMIILGIVPLEGRAGLLEALDKGEAATHALNLASNSPLVSISAQCFALFAIITSFLAQSLSLVDFLADGLKISKRGMNRFLLLVLSLIPPFCLALLYPTLFIAALNFAGGVCAVLLFGVIPALMLFVLRHRKSHATLNPLLSAKSFLSLILICAVCIVALEVAQELNLSTLSWDRVSTNRELVGVEHAST
jgi:tyrosine-specific transport protein